MKSSKLIEEIEGEGQGRREKEEKDEKEREMCGVSRKQKDISHIILNFNYCAKSKQPPHFSFIF